MTKRSERQPTAASGDCDAVTRLVGRHLRVGWWTILAYLSLGIVLEGLHAYKIGWYLNVSNESRRLMWSLAHAHGTLCGLLHLAFAATIALAETKLTVYSRAASPCFVAAGLLLPLGFLLGGLFIHGGDPGYGILLVPAGAVLLLAAALCSALLCKDQLVRTDDPNSN